MSITVDVSIGEFLDKLTILQIKSERIRDTKKLRNVRHELNTLTRLWRQHRAGHVGIEHELSELRAVNENLWVIEDALREKEAARDFGDDFIHLARSVYLTNDRRAAIKKRINEKLDSGLIEEKSYACY